MDKALELRMSYDDGNIISTDQAENLLNNSDLVRELITTQVLNTNHFMLYGV